ncbi:MAG TPA: hypothetical protein QGF75_02525 [Candidatus Marinimicrobia bacterium]|nr:hypothetical protein [Candidatus Neomarinimicrobiota bacterium]|tara:strand:+ start:2620 stop:3636 length:1017 start_codon:yes stop_codon:yes gene_type:complete
MTIVKNREFILFKSLLVIVILFALFSCSNPSSNNEMEANEEIAFNYNLEFNDTDIMSSDSLYYELTFDMIGAESLNMSIAIDSIAYESFEISSIDSSIQILNGHIPVSDASKSIQVSFIKDDMIITEKEHAIPLRKNIAVTTFSDNNSNKNVLFANNRFINHTNIIYDKFEKYDFTNTEIVILDDLDMLSDKMVVELQKFLLNDGFVIVLMNENIKVNNELAYSLGYPQIKAIRGASRNQFFSVIDQGFLKKHSFFSKNVANQTKVYRYFELKDSEKDFSRIMISTNDPLLIEKDVLGGKIFFLTTKIDSNWSNESFDLLLTDIFNSIFFQRFSYNES